MKKSTFCALAIALLGLLAASQTSQAGLITFSGSGTSGAISVPRGTVPWVVANNAWGIPGVGRGYTTWTAAESFSQVTIQFDNLPENVHILTPNPLSNKVFMYNASTATTFEPELSPDAKSITFRGPGGATVNPGNFFFLNVSFNADPGSSLSFHGAFDPQLATAPEPATLGMALIPLVAAAVRLARKRTAKSSNLV